VSTTTARGGWRRRLPFLAVLSLLLSVPIGLAVQTPAHATTTVSLFAGTGWSGYDGDEKPATTAKLWGPKDLATDAAGNVYFADKYNHIVRRIDTAGTIHLVRGTPSTAHNVYAGGLNRPAGVAITADDGTSGYIADTSNHVVVTLTGGAIWAGNDCGVGGFGGDGGPAHTSGPAGTGDPNCTQTTPSPVKLNQPSGLGFDSGTGVLYIADTNNCRIRLANGGINTVAGNGNCTSVGAGGNVGDGGPATSAQLAYPDDVAAGNGKLYIADTNNCRIRWVNLSTNVINTLVGSGSCSDGVQSPRGIVVDKVGNVYFGSQDGTVRRVNPLGTMSTVAGGLGSSVAGVTRDLAGNIYASVQFDKIYKISGYNSSATVSNVNATVTANDPRVPQLGRRIVHESRR
jgi:streptogramin lyase